MTTYSLTCINNSQMSGSFAVFQKPPPMTIPGNIFSLAWFARPTAVSSKVTFTWGLDYSFVWSETGLLQPGINFAATQNVAADPNGQNVVQLTQDGFGATTFANPAGTGAIGSLTIQQLSNVQPNYTSVGIGMAGSGTHAVQAAPNMTAVFTPHPNYWVIFGNYTTGDVMDIEDISSAVEVTYGGALTSRTATLGLNNLITTA
ncbi:MULTISPECIES: hypothetical protein [Rhizobium]|uniref:Protein rhiA n=1 Tax=Rhizobium rhododendri TaxID=2506430 RepID=A0ABY8IHC2_9HYPH|nr:MULTISPECIES: hypothetical protein [Rhizobium]MBZ5760799.1 protein rhiA [Rhizobium sp. VS19-DR96]MBZ5765417.1 protein rhiA [Rhizobium sp. VS19-DR129.2]MBZ5774620.1 protein rhiA [Rhizobium sp. VS19-DRK62.2]MBZ5784634.1 protein rhiA [Rhizobium sp. VS19-DR121]MBZ5801246.1 protein rhiA [Rhizobium sp. VS19-DR181]